MVGTETIRRCGLTSITLLLICTTISVMSCTVETRFFSDADAPHTYTEFAEALAETEGGASPNDPIDIAFDGAETTLALYAALGRAQKYVNLNLSESSVTGFGDTNVSNPSGMSFIVSIVLPNNLARIGRKAFEGCAYLREVIIPDSVTEIGEYAFHSCPSLADITIPESVRYIDRDAFSGCGNLATVRLMGDVRIADNTVFPSSVKFREVAMRSEDFGTSSYIAARGLYLRNGTEWSRL